MEKSRFFYYNILFILVLFLCVKVIAQRGDTQTIMDSIEIYKAYSKDKTKYKDKDRLFFAERARDLAIGLKNDSILIHVNRRLSTVYWEVKRYDAYEKINRKNLYLSQKVGDSSSLARAYFKLGVFYRVNKVKTDSSYYYYHKADNLYRLLEDNFNIVQTLHDLSIYKKMKKIL